MNLKATVNEEMFYNLKEGRTNIILQEIADEEGPIFIESGDTFTIEKVYRKTTDTFYETEQITRVIQGVTILPPVACVIFEFVPIEKDVDWKENLHSDELDFNKKVGAEYPSKIKP